MCNRYTPARGDDPRFDLLGRVQVNLPPEPMWRPIGPRAPGPILLVDQAADHRHTVLARWGMIRPGSPTAIEAAKDGRPMMTNNARSETMRKSPTFGPAWKADRRCIIPAWSYDEPNWELGKNVWWRMARADGTPWGIAGLWSEWIDPDTGELMPNYTMPTINVDGHPLLSRMHKPQLDKDRNPLPADQQDKRGIVPLEPEDWKVWLFGTKDEALALLHSLPVSVYSAGPAPKDEPRLDNSLGLF